MILVRTCNPFPSPRAEAPDLIENAARLLGPSEAERAKAALNARHLRSDGQAGCEA